LRLPALHLRRGRAGNTARQRQPSSTSTSLFDSSGASWKVKQKYRALDLPPKPQHCTFEESSIYIRKLNSILRETSRQSLDQAIAKAIAARLIRLAVAGQIPAIREVHGRTEGKPPKEVVFEDEKTQLLKVLFEPPPLRNFLPARRFAGT
jgi:hypothetical protein